MPAGGSGSRLLPLTKITNKHLLPVGREPMIVHPVRKLTRAGIRDILVVTGCEHMGDVVGLLGSGRDFDCEFTYRVQDRAGGIAQALALGKDFARGDKMVVLLGDNFYASGVDSVEDALFSENFAKLYDTEQLGNLTWHAILGNHDYQGNVEAQIQYTERSGGRWYMPAHYYRRDFAGASGTLQQRPGSLLMFAGCALLIR